MFSRRLADAGQWPHQPIRTNWGDAYWRRTTGTMRRRAISDPVGKSCGPGDLHEQEWEREWWSRWLVRLTTPQSATTGFEHRFLIRNLIRYLNPEPLISVEAPPNVEVVLQSDEANRSAAHYPDVLLLPRHLLVMTRSTKSGCDGLRNWDTGLLQPCLGTNRSFAGVSAAPTALRRVRTTEAKFN